MGEKSHLWLLSLEDGVYEEHSQAVRDATSQIISEKHSLRVKRKEKQARGFQIHAVMFFYLSQTCSYQTQNEGFAAGYCT